MKKKHWKIVDGKLPDDLKAELDGWLANYSPEKVLGNPVRPPWMAFPDDPPNSMRWRMGGGEDFIDMFCKWYGEQTSEERQTFKDKFPIPPEWQKFMNRRDSEE